MAELLLEASGMIGSAGDACRDDVEADARVAEEERGGAARKEA